MMKRCRWLCDIHTFLTVYGSYYSLWHVSYLVDVRGWWPHSGEPASTPEAQHHQCLMNLQGRRCSSRKILWGCMRALYIILILLSRQWWRHTFLYNSLKLIPSPLKEGRAGKLYYSCECYIRRRATLRLSEREQVHVHGLLLAPGLLSGLCIELLHNVVFSFLSKSSQGNGCICKISN